MQLDWIECVRWCHGSQSLDHSHAVVCSLIELAEQSKYPNPVLVYENGSEHTKVAGYVELYPGLLGAIGNLRIVATSNDTFVSPLDERELLTDTISNLCESGFAHGIEIIQAIYPLALPPAVECDVVPQSTDWIARDEAFDVCMDATAILVQMGFDLTDIEFPNRVVTEESLSMLRFLKYDEISTANWHRTIEATYQDTLDVPELNGRRSMPNTLEGYAASIKSPMRPWWVIQSNGENIGCIMLTPLGHERTEITYLGLIKSMRGLGLSQKIMQFILEQMKPLHSTQLSVAVDVRNAPAIRLYQRTGFTVKGFVRAWIRAFNDRKNISSEDSS